MYDARPSRTAQRVALRRAAHQILDMPRVLDDPIALRIVGAQAAAALVAAPAKQEGRASRALRAFIVVRSRLAEDELRRAAARGTTQYVILGAGLDTFAYRGCSPASLTRVFEVDHPATQAWKRRQLEAAGISLPSSLTLAPVDFERQTLAEGLAHAGFRRDAPTFFSWLGVSMYLTDEAIAATLAFVASTPAGGGLVFDYCVPRSSLTFLRRLAFDALARRVAAAGEPFRSFFDPRALTLRLSGMGFRAVQDYGSDELNARYFQERADGLRVRGNLGRIVVAEI